jgi:ABC-type transporter Mla subunit MlaD
MSDPCTFTDFIQISAWWSRECAIAAPGGKPLVVPIIVLLVVAVLFVFFAYSWGRLVWLSLRYQRRMKQHIAFLREQRTEQRAISAAVLNRVGEVLAKDDLCKYGWNEFNETLVKDDAGRGPEIYGTRHAHDLFSGDAIISASMSPGFFQAVPGILTSMGLFGTFLAILVGLAAIHVPEAETTAAGATERIEGIGVFVNALSGKFLSSVLALAFAIFFTLIEQRSFRKAEATHRTFCEAFDGVFPRRTSEELLMSVLGTMRGQNAAFEHFNTDLSARFRDGVSEGLGPVLDRVSNGLQALAGERDSNIEALMERLTQEFRSAMSQSAGVEFQQIASAVQQASALLSDANSQSEQTQASFNGLVAAMTQSTAQQKELAEQQAQAMRAMLQQMVEGVGRAASSSQAALDETIRALVERTRDESSQSAKLLQSELQTQSRQVNEQINALLVRVEQASQKMESAGVDGSRELLETIQRVSSSMEASAGRVAEQLNTAASGVVDRTGSVSERMTRELQQVLDEHRASVASVTQMREALQQTVAVWLQATDQTRAAFASLRESSALAESTTQSLKEVASAVTRAQERLNSMLGVFQTELPRFQSMADANRGLLGEHQRVFNDLRTGLGAVLSTITEKIQAFQEVSSRGLTAQLREFDNHLGTATQKLGAAVDELSEVLESATDRLSGPAPRP